jgi:hypothetical protein
VGAAGEAPNTAAFCLQGSEYPTAVNLLQHVEWERLTRLELEALHEQVRLALLSPA